MVYENNKTFFKELTLCLQTYELRSQREKKNVPNEDKHRTLSYKNCQGEKNVPNEDNLTLSYKKLSPKAVTTPLSETLNEGGD